MPEEHRHRHLVWPFILILLGVALLLDRLEIWSFPWSDIWRLWPLILILLGLDMLLSRTRPGGVVFLLIAGAIVVLAVVFLRPSQSPARGHETEFLKYPGKGAEAANIHLEMSVGKLTVSPLRDSANLFEAEIEYDKRRTHVTYDTSMDGDRAQVRLKSSQVTWSPFGAELRNEWRIWLNPDVPIQLDIDGGVNDAMLDLTHLHLTGLDLDMGVGNVNVLLADKGSYEADIDGGIGSLTIEIPRDAEARIRVDGGIGSVSAGRRFERKGKYYVTEGFESSKDAIDIDIDGGIGSVTIR